MSPVTMYGIILAVVAVVAIVAATIAPASQVNIFGFAGVIAGLLITSMQKSQADEKIAKKVEQVSVAAAEQSVITAHMAKEVSATHTLTNSNYGASLKATLNALTLVDTLTVDPKIKVFSARAVADAQDAYNEHMASQAVVDSGARTVVDPRLIPISTPVPTQPVTTITQSPGSMEVVVTDKSTGDKEVVTGDSVSVTSKEDK